MPGSGRAARWPLRGAAKSARQRKIGEKLLGARAPGTSERKGPAIFAADRQCLQAGRVQIFVFVFPSRTDTFGLVLLGATATATPSAAAPRPRPLHGASRHGLPARPCNPRRHAAEP